MITFLDEKLAAASGAADRPPPARPTLPLPGGAHALVPILAALSKHAAPLSPEAAAAVARVAADARAVQAALVQAPNQAPGGAAPPNQVAAPGQAPPQAPGADGEAAAPGQPSGFKKEVEDDANYIFQQARL